MSYGIRIFNNTGGGVIDGYNFQMVFVGKLTIQVAGLTPYSTVNGVTTGVFGGTGGSVVTYVPWLNAAPVSPIVFVGAQQAQSNKYGTINLKSFGLWGQQIMPANAGLNPQYMKFQMTAIGDYALNAGYTNIQLLRPIFNLYLFDILDTNAASSDYGFKVTSQRTDAFGGLNTFTTSQVPLVISGYAKTNGLQGAQTLIRGSVPTNWAVSTGQLGWLGDSLSPNIGNADILYQGVGFTSPQVPYVTTAYGNASSQPTATQNYLTKDQYMMFINRDLYD